MGGGGAWGEEVVFWREITVKIFRYCEILWSFTRMSRQFTSTKRKMTSSLGQSSLSM